MSESIIEEKVCNAFYSFCLFLDMHNHINITFVILLFPRRKYIQFAEQLVDERKNDVYQSFGAHYLSKQKN